MVGTIGQRPVGAAWIATAYAVRVRNLALAIGLLITVLSWAEFAVRAWRSGSRVTCAKYDCLQDRTAGEGGARSSYQRVGRVMQ